MFLKAYPVLHTVLSPETRDDWDTGPPLKNATV